MFISVITGYRLKSRAVAVSEAINVKAIDVNYVNEKRD